MKVLNCVAVVMAYVTAISNIAQISPHTKLSSSDPDVNTDFLGICSNHGYSPESYTVTTEDGYHLLLFRIPRGKTQTFDQVLSGSKRPVVFLQHGILDSADTFVNNSPDKAPAFILADAGYDVWLGNSRGNYYSRHHTIYDPDKDKQFWDFSFSDMGKYDLPTVITKALEVSGAKKLTYIGHSQGTSQMFYALSYNEEWFLERVNLFVALGPVTNLANCKAGLLDLIADTHIETLLTPIVWEMFPRNYLANKFYSTVCATIPQICSFGVFIISDEDISKDNQDRWDVMLAHFPSGSSLKCFVHYAQSIRTKTFREYDYGKTENIKKYGVHPPPNIPVYNIKKMPIALFVGTADKLATVDDNSWLQSILGIKVKEDDNIDGEGHMTFLMGKDQSYLDEVLSLMEKYKEE